VIIADKKSIHDRPPEASAKTEIGHWEIDLIESKGKDSYLFTGVERTVKYTVMSKSPTKSSADIVKAIQEAFAFIPNKHIKTLTSDNGAEFSLFKTIEELFECDHYFADPYSAWQRGLNENTNGLIRQYLPKNKSFARITDEDIEKIQMSLNNRPRKSLHNKAPIEAFYKLFIVALDP
jgi:IS30 family transposase